MIGKRTDEDVLDFIDAYWEEYWTSPSFEQIGLYTGLKSKATVHHHMNKLVRQGVLEKKLQADRRKSALFRRVV